MSLTREDLMNAVPDVSAPLALKGLDASVTVWRDIYGIPHVQSSTPHDAFFAQGFIAAQDRLWQMEYDRRRAYGRWAECAGPVALSNDLAMRRFRLEASAKADYRLVDANAKAMLDAYAAGVNAFIDLGRWPIEYKLVEMQPEPWQPWDCLAVFKVRHIGMGVYGSKLWRARLLNALGPEHAAQLFPAATAGEQLIVPPGAVYDGPPFDPTPYFEEGLGWGALREAFGDGSNPQGESNSWVIAGARTKSGMPFLAGDSHRPLDTPNVYYQNHIACSEFDVIGLSFPGVPGFPHFGHNARVAWCVTHTSADYQDLYLERFDPSDPAKYEYEGRWLNAETYHEEVSVRGGAPVSLHVTVTHHGPIIDSTPEAGLGIALRYTATASGSHTWVSCLTRMLEVSDVDEMDDAMRGWVDPCNNLLFADVDGNVAYLNRGRIPVRPSANAWLPVPGWTGKHEWQDEIPFENWLRLRNPESGYIVTANNRVAGAAYPYHVSVDFAPDLRARRLLDRVAGLTSATADDMTSVHADAVSLLARRLSALLSRVPPGEGDAGWARDTLVPWDGTMDRDAIAPTVYSAFRRSLDERLVSQVLGPLAEEALQATGGASLGHVRRLTELFVRAVEDDDASLLPENIDWPTLLNAALADAVAFLRERWGGDASAWQWGRVHKTRPRHNLSDSFPAEAGLLDPPGVPLGGDGDTLLRAAHVPSRPFDIVANLSVARYVFDLGDWEQSAWVIPLGSSGHPGSPHYADQAPIWAEVELVPMLYVWPRIKADSVSKQSLAPGA